MQWITDGTQRPGTVRGPGQRPEEVGLELLDRGEGLKKATRGWESAPDGGNGPPDPCGRVSPHLWPEWRAWVEINTAQWNFPR